MSQFCNRSDHPVSPTVQCDIKISLVNWVVSDSRPIMIVGDDGLLLVFRTALSTAEYKLHFRRTIDKMYYVWCFKSFVCETA